MKEKIRFLHCADLHLDSPFKGFSHHNGKIFQEMKESTFKAFQSIVQHAVEQHVDFVVMVGDIFDQDGRSLKAQLRLKKGFEQLAAHNIPVYLSHGNHDYMDASYYPVDYPDNVHIFSSEQVEHVSFHKKGKHVAEIYGFSYEQRAIGESKHLFYERTADDVYHIGMLHGSLATNTDHDVYAPFTLEELVARGMDYWALGHIHKRQQLHEDPPVVYSGNIQGRHRKEIGEKGCYIVDITPHDTSMTFLPTNTIRFEKRELYLDECTTIQQVERLVHGKKEEWRREYGKAMIELHLFGHVPSTSIIEELRDIWNDQEDSESPWIWLHTIKVHATPKWDREQLKQGAHFIGEILRQKDKRTDIENDVKDLLYHKQVRKYMPTFTEEEQKDIIEHAEQLLLNQLLEMEGKM
ncbi:metallophosphoesterase family protein [Pontibacillus litoralis]|uniref:Calcineurin-like phosphoesterase domain-containing protein n=1 Tax=Pontibacillus litoralis JSM 072002 TaxID=1385512 RepID=A0A0A5HNR8_9BACI|nr:DNA repair exonuclease [Pontibacillus litoralis]KGX85282.1 hypothetical protein N784_09585 [Pontibacillus litoralis JSM 072002]